MRACGYCREVGHVSTRCHRLTGQIESIRRHVGGERHALHNLMLENGLGVGAIIRHSYYNDNPTEYVITSLRESIGMTFDVGIDWRIHKYKKSVQSSLRSWSGANFLTADPDGYFVRRYNSDRFYIGCRELNNMGRVQYLTFFVSGLAAPPQWARAADIHRYSNPPVVLCPSSDTDIRPEDLNFKILLHDRLIGKDGNRYVTPIIP